MIRSKSFSTIDQLKKDILNKKPIDVELPTDTPTPTPILHEYQLAQYVVQIFDYNSDSPKLPLSLQQFYTNKTLYSNSIQYIVLSCPASNVLPFFTIENNHCQNITLENILTNESVELTTDILIDGFDQSINQFDLYFKVNSELEAGNFNLSFQPTDSSGKLLNTILTIQITINPQITKSVFTDSSISIEDVIQKYEPFGEYLFGSLIPTCSICYNPLCSSDEPLVTLQSIEYTRGNIRQKNTCGHTFHSKCIDVWKKTSQQNLKTTKCPICRSTSIPLVINF